MPNNLVIVNIYNNKYLFFHRIEAWKTCHSFKVFARICSANLQHVNMFVLKVNNSNSPLLEINLIFLNFKVTD
jgi:hypothetical protein